MKNSRAVILVLIVTIALMGGLTVRQYAVYRSLSKPGEQGSRDQKTAQKNDRAAVSSPDVKVSVERQKAGDSLTVNYVKIKEKGFIVIRRVAADGSPGNIIGSLAVTPGEYFNAVIKLDEPVANGDSLMATIHRDDGDGKLTFPGPDAAITDTGGNEIVSKFFIGPKPTVNPE